MMNSKLKKGLMLLTVAVTLTACSKGDDPEMGQLKTENKQEIEANKQEEIKKTLDDDKFTISKDKIKGDKDLEEKLNKPIVEKYNKISDLVVLPKDIKSIYKELSTKNVEITDEQAKLQAKLEKNPINVLGDNDSVDWGDTAYITAELKDKNGGSIIPKYDKEAFGIKLGGKYIPEEFEKEVIGMKKGQTKKMQASFPEDFYDMDLAGRSVEAYIKVFGIERPDEPTEEEIRLAKVNLRDMLSYSNQKNASIQLVDKVKEATEIKKYPLDIIKELRKEYKEDVLVNEKKVMNNMKKNEMDLTDIKDAEDLYVLNNIETRLLALALSEKTGINKQSQEIEEYMSKNDISNAEEITDEQFCEAILETMVK